MVPPEEGHGARVLTYRRGSPSYPFRPPGPAADAKASSARWRMIFPKFPFIGPPDVIVPAAPGRDVGPRPPDCPRRRLRLKRVLVGPHPSRRVRAQILGRVGPYAVGAVSVSGSRRFVSSRTV